MREPLLISTKDVPPLALDIPISSIEALDSVDLTKVAFLVLDLSDWQFGYQQLLQIRSHVNPKLYLKPLLFSTTSDDVPREVMQAADGVLNPEEGSSKNAIISWSSKLEGINARIDELKEITSAGDSNIAFKVLRFIETRNLAFTPIPSANKTTGYIYPALQPLFPKEDIGVLETLEYLEGQRLLTGEFVSRSYGCTHCGCAFLNFVETCTDCGSGDLRTEELIHHFKCAYVGEMSDFKQGQNFVCPKCDRTLKHIGVDYDKASVVYHCKACSNVFQEPQIMTSCYNCWRETEPENQIIRDIQSYSITSIGENAARYGMDSLLQTILESRMDTIPFDVFKEFFRLEIARIERYKVSTSCLVLMRLGGIEEIYGRLGKRATEVFNELSEALKAQLRNSDIFSVRDENIFLIILTETPKENAELAISRLEERIISLLSSNLKMEFKVDKTIHPITAQIDLEVSIEQLLQAHVT